MAGAKRGRLARKLKRGGDMEFSPEQIVEIKRLFVKMFTPDYVDGFAQLLGVEEE